MKDKINERIGNKEKIGSESSQILEAIEFSEKWNLVQHIKNPTRGNNILDVILTNLHIVPPISPDVPGKGAPSDYCGNIATPHTSSLQPKKRKSSRKIIRPIPESLLPTFEHKLQKTDFSAIYLEPNSTQMVQKYEEILAVMKKKNFHI